MRARYYINSKHKHLNNRYHIELMAERCNGLNYKKFNVMLEKYHSNYRIDSHLIGHHHHHQHNHLILYFHFAIIKRTLFFLQYLYAIHDMKKEKEKLH